MVEGYVVDEGEADGDPEEAEDSAEALAQDEEHHGEVGVDVEAQQEIEAQHEEGPEEAHSQAKAYRVREARVPAKIGPEAMSAILSITEDIFKQYTYAT